MSFFFILDNIVHPGKGQWWILAAFIIVVIIGYIVGIKITDWKMPLCIGAMLAYFACETIVAFISISLVSYIIMPLGEACAGFFIGYCLAGRYRGWRG